MKWWRWLMSWFRRSDDRHRSAEQRLRQVERAEERAMQRVVDAGVRVTLHADTSAEAVDEILADMERRKNRGERVVMTAEGVLRLLERDRRQ
jgi:hypothetical protein